MPGIVVGVDGSGPSRAALEWAVREAAARHAPLIVVTVHQAPVQYLGSAVDQTQDHDLAERYRRTAQEAVDRVYARIGGFCPDSVRSSRSMARRRKRCSLRPWTLTCSSSARAAPAVPRGR